MPQGGKQSLRRQIPDAGTWKQLKGLYCDIHFDTERCEAVEADGVELG
jgi:hypothetical protein